MILSVTKQFRFEACHHLPHYNGKCRNLHGHSYKLEVTVSGSVVEDTENPKCGMIIDFNDIKEIVENEIIRYVDHTDLNTLYDNPTAEIMVVDFFKRIYRALPKSMKVVRVRLWETDSSYAEYSLEDGEEYALLY